MGSSVPSQQGVQTACVPCLQSRLTQPVLSPPLSLPLAIQIELKLEYSSDRVVDLTQMPVLPYALRAIYNQTKDAALIHEFLPPLVR